MKRLIFLMAILGALSAPVRASAATLSFITDQSTIGAGNPFEVAVMLNTENKVNAIGAAISVPSGLELVKTSNGNSVMSFWVEQPQFDTATRMLVFSGIIPGGYSGTGQLLTLTLKAARVGSSVLSFDPVRTALYHNDPNGTPEPTNVQSLVLHAVAGTTSVPASIIDTVPPEAFTPIVTHDPQLYDNAWTFVFATQDKGSGVAYYEVSESPVRAANPDALSWTKAESPYRLVNQTPAKYIYVRAVDERRNIRTELYTPIRSLSWFEGLGLGILILALVFFVLWLGRKKRRYVSL